MEFTYPSAADSLTMKLARTPNSSNRGVSSLSYLALRDLRRSEAAESSFDSFPRTSTAFSYYRPVIITKPPRSPPLPRILSQIEALSQIKEFLRHNHAVWYVTNAPGNSLGAPFSYSPQ